ncbi:MAG: NAD-dependent epimerase/dehydratase family protein [Thermoplasmatota archaeon]
MSIGRRAVVTGGGGFLGGIVVRKLLEEGYEVSSYSRKEYAHLEKMGAGTLKGDICDQKRTLEAFRDFDVVIHVAAKVGYWGEREDFRLVNVEGTKNVIEACRKSGIRNLVYTCSPSVVFDGKDQKGLDEGAPYPRRYDSFYSKSKAEAERIVLGANSEELRTISLRPHLVWGPGDTHIIPGIIQRAKEGKMVRVGSGKNIADMVYVDNAADAHVLADRALDSNPESRGKAYFITNDEPRNVWDFIDEILRSAGLDPVKRTVPRGAAMVGATFMELFYSLFKKGEEPNLTRFLIRELTASHWYDISAAKRDLGYRPKVSMDEGLERLEKWFRSGNA